MTFEESYHKYFNLLVWNMIKRFKNRNNALDAVQTVFTKVLENGTVFKGDAFGLLYIMAKNQIITEGRRHSNHGHDSLEYINEVSDRGIQISDGSDVLRIIEARDRLRALKQNLNGSYQMLEDVSTTMSYNDARKKYRCSMGAIKSRINRARQHAKALADDR